MAISVTGSDFNSEMDVDKIFDDSSLHDPFLEVDDRDQFSDMPPLLQDFSDDEGEEGDPLHEGGHVKSRSLLDLLDDTILSSMDEESSVPSIVPVAASVPDALQHEDTPVDLDDVQPAERPSRPACEVLDDASPYWFWRIILLLVPWLNLHYHLPHRANNLILKVLTIIFHSLGAFGVQDKPEQTLKTVYARLELTDHFDIHPLCPNCCRVYPPDSDSTTHCLDCDIFLFRGVTASDEDAARPSLPNSSTSALTSGPKPWPPTSFKCKPKLQCAQHPLSNALLRLVWQDGIEKEVDQWRKDQSPPGIRTCIQDGEVWKSLHGADGKLFFDNSPDRSDQDELRIGITLGFDGYV